VRVAADDERPVSKRRVLELLDGGEEGVQVEVRDDHGTSVVVATAVSFGGRSKEGGGMPKVISQLASAGEAALGKSVKVGSQLKERLEVMMRTVTELEGRVDELEKRVGALEKPKARAAKSKPAGEAPKPEADDDAA